MSSAELQTTLPVEVGYRRFLGFYYLWIACYDLVFAYSVYTIFFRLRGLSVVQIALLLSWWSLSSLLLEIPTGALADCWSWRAMLIISPLIKALCFVTWFLADGHFYLYALGFLFWSLGSSCVSGTEEALLYDTLVHHGRQQEYARILGRASSYNYLAQGIGGIIGGVLASIRLEWPIILSVIPMICTALFALNLTEPPRAKTVQEMHFMQHIRLAMRELHDNCLLRYFSLYLLGISIVGELEEFDQLYYQFVHLPISVFGVAGIIWMSLNALGAHFAHRIKSTFALYCLPIISAALLLLVWRFPSIPGIGLLLLAYAVVTPARILAESRVQYCITGSSRATVTSTVYFLMGTLTFAVPVALGYIAKIWQLPSIYLTGALQLLAVAGWMWSRRERIGSDKYLAKRNESMANG